MDWRVGLTLICMSCWEGVLPDPEMWVRPSVPQCAHRVVGRLHIHARKVLLFRLASLESLCTCGTV